MTCAVIVIVYTEKIAQRNIEEIGAYMYFLYVYGDGFNEWMNERTERGV
jgi:hypothetical protein